MWASRLKEFAAMISIGDGVLALIAPRNHVALWLLGPMGLRKLTLWFAENPTYTRLGGIAETGFGIWLALRQYQEAPRPWYQRWFSQYYLLGLLPSLGLLTFALAVVYMHARDETASGEDQAREGLARGEEVAKESRKGIGNIIREAVRKSRPQR